MHPATAEAVTRGEDAGARGSAVASLEGQDDFTDEQMLAYEQTIKDEEANKLPLVCEKETLDALAKEYAGGSEGFKNKIKHLQQTHHTLRRCRGDGNCFYRAFAFAWYERLLKKGRAEDHREAAKQLESSCDLLDQAGFRRIAYEDFFAVAREIFLALPCMTEARLLEHFQDPETSNAIVVHFRFVTSAFLKTHADDYLPFLDTAAPMDIYCANNVEAMGREVEQIHIVALAKAFNVTVRICYLSGSISAHEANFHEFSPDSPPKQGSFVSPLSFLYRPGHYDLLD